MIRFARVLMIAVTVFVLSVAVTSVSSADAGKSGATVTVQRQGTIAPGHMRPASEVAVQGDSQFFGQYFNWSAFYMALFLYYKIGRSI